MIIPVTGNKDKLCFTGHMIVGSTD
jgi:hypothetical protein